MIFCQRKILSCLLISLGCFGLQTEAQTSQKPGDWQTLKLAYNKPTDKNDFGAALPIGNGRLGAKIYGNVTAELLNVNETTLWSGIPRSYNDANSAKVLIAVRQALANADYKKADSLSRLMQGKNNESYLPLGNIQLDFDSKAFTSYTRELDLGQALITIHYTIDNVKFTREIFASYPDQIIAMRIYADKKNSVSFTANLNTKLQGKTTIEGQTIVVNGRAPIHVDNYTKKEIIEWDAKKGMAFQSRLNIKTASGSVKVKGDSSLIIASADTAMLIFSAATSFNGIDKEPGTEGIDPEPVVKKYIANAANKTWQQLLSNHLQDYQSLFRRLWVDINNEKPNKYALAYQWARYNLLACSRPKSGAPRNEQGIWNRDLFPRYASNYTLNENPNKYYALAEPANIAETTDPLLKYIGDLAKNGTVTASANYGFKGWVAHHNSDIWAMTTMANGDPCWAAWPMGGIWLCENIWDRYEFSNDKNYLRTQAWPILKGAAEFALDLLVTNKDGIWLLLHPLHQKIISLIPRATKWR